MRSASVPGTGRCLVDLDLQQIKIVLRSKSFADVWVAAPEAEETRCGGLFSDEGGGEQGGLGRLPFRSGSVCTGGSRGPEPLCIAQGPMRTVFKT